MDWVHSKEHANKENSQKFASYFAKLVKSIKPWSENIEKVQKSVLYSILRNHGVGILRKINNWIQPKNSVLKLAKFDMLKSSEQKNRFLCKRKNNTKTGWHLEKSVPVPLCKWII